MGRKIKTHETGVVVGRHQSWRGAMISVAVTLSAREWSALTRNQIDLWHEAQDDIEMRDLTLDDRIALFVSDEADRWCQRVGGSDRFESDLGDDVPF